MEELAKLYDKEINEVKDKVMKELDKAIEKGMEIGVDYGTDSGMLVGSYFTEEFVKMKIIKNMLNDNLSVEKVCKYTGLTEKKVNELMEKKVV